VISSGGASGGGGKSRLLRWCARVGVRLVVEARWGVGNGHGSMTCTCVCGRGEIIGYMAVSEVQSVTRFFDGEMYWGSGVLRLVCALTRFVDRFYDGGVYKGGSGLRLPECVVDQFCESASLLRDMSLWRFQSCVGLCVSSSVSVGNAIGVGRLRQRCILSSKSCGLSSVSQLWIQVLCVCVGVIHVRCFWRV
jgi:hypothetical protein